MSQTKNSIFQENVFVGSECEKIMKELDLNPKSELMNWFYDKVLSFYMTVSKYLQKYFRKGLLSTSLKYMKALGPSMRKNYGTPHMLSYLCTNMSKVAERIQPDGGGDT